MTGFINEWKQFLMEGRWDRETTAISRDVVNFLKEEPEDGYWKLDNEIFPCPIFVEVENVDMERNFLSISARYDYEENEVIISIMYDKDSEDTVFSDMLSPQLVSTLKERVRHELEHLSQIQFAQRNPNIDMDIELARKGDPNELYKYYSNPLEMEAFMSGLYKRAKSERVAFNKLYDEWLKTVSDDLLSPPSEFSPLKPSYVDKIDKDALKYVRARFPKAQLQEAYHKTDINKGQANDIWYHGSPKSFTAFQPSIKKTFGSQPSKAPLFFTKDISFAKSYAGGTGYIYSVLLNINNTFSGDDMYVANSKYWPPDYDELTEIGKKLHDDLEGNKIFSDLIADYSVDEGESNWAEMHDIYGTFVSILKGDYDTVETSEFKGWLRSNGYDSFWVTGDGEKNMAVLDEKNIEIVNVVPV